MGELRSQLAVGVLIAAAICVSVWARMFTQALPFGMGTGDLTELVWTCAVLATLARHTFFASSDKRWQKLVAILMPTTLAILYLFHTHSEIVLLAGGAVSISGLVMCTVILAQADRVGGAK
jgi:hypothetical protein